MFIDPEEVKLELSNRGCKLNAGASKYNIDRLSKIFPDAPKYMIYLYHTFDGFKANTFDNLSKMSIWNIDELIKFSREYKSDSLGFAFGDKLMNSDFMFIVQEQQYQQVIMLESRLHVANSFEHFIFKLLNSEYDLV